MKIDKSENISIEESSMKRLDGIIKKNKAETEALKKLLIGLEKLEKNIKRPKQVKNKL